MAAVIDHVEPFATGGGDDEKNFATACCKCNARKSSRIAADYLSETPARRVRGRYGEPEHWDGLTSLFLVLAERDLTLTLSEKAWEREIKAYLRNRRK
jgi:hypothetical protein